MNAVIRGVRVFDPLAGLDLSGRDVRFEDGHITVIGRDLEAGDLADIDLTPPAGAEPCVLCPGFIDLHAHLREPGDEAAETLASGAAAAAAGGFTTVLAMANTRPPIDGPDAVAAAVGRAAGLPIRILTVAALTRGLAGTELVDVAGCADAGAVAFSDDGRNAAPAALLAEGLRTAAAHGDHPVLIHAEDEALIGHSSVDPARRPAEAEASAVAAGIAALASGGGAGRLHLQHISTAEAVRLLREARRAGLPLTAEVTPHHLSMFETDPLPDPPSLARVNPPLRDRADGEALVAALAEGVVDAVATDHAPHLRVRKGVDQAGAAPGMTGLETALATCLGVRVRSPDWVALLVERLTVGPHRVLRHVGSLPPPGLALDMPATCVLFDPAQEWTVGPSTVRSRSSNTPLWGRRLRGQVLLTLVEGAVAHRDTRLQIRRGPGVHV
ncbi:MAG: dihydroorotase [Candidatus Dormibacteria bacterium]